VKKDNSLTDLSTADAVQAQRYSRRHFLAVASNHPISIFSTRQRMPSDGRTLTRETGKTLAASSGTNEKRRNTSHKINDASSCAIVAPVHARGPRPKGK